MDAREFIKACVKKDKDLIKREAEKLIEKGEDENMLRGYYDFTHNKIF